MPIEGLSDTGVGISKLVPFNSPGQTCEPDKDTRYNTFDSTFKPIITENEVSNAFFTDHCNYVHYISKQNNIVDLQVINKQHKLVNL